MADDRSRDRDIEELRTRLAEAEETLRAIRQGEVDAVIVEGADGPKVYTLRTADHVYRILVEQMPRGAIILSTHGDILYCNRWFSELIEAAPETLIGGSLDRFLPEAERPAVAAIRAAGHGSHRGHLATTSGTLIPAYLSFEKVLVDGVEICCLIVSDLREILGAQAALAHAQAEARAKDEFLAMLGHELRNPLGAVAAALGILNAGNAPAEATERAHAVIGRQIAHLSRLVNDLLDVARVTSGKVMLVQRPLDLASLVSELMGAWRSTGRFQWHQVTLDVRPVWVSADETRLEQILSNLVGNALKYTPAGGRVTVWVGPAGEAAVLEVADTGRGIPPELMGRVFDLFVQGDRSLDRPAGGLGVGLTLVRTLAERHGGVVEARSEGPGKGAVFTVRLPRIPAAMEQPGHLVAKPCATGAMRRRILVVEDNEDAREMLRTVLTIQGHEVYAAADGLAAVDMAAILAPDVALIDVGLPGLNGYETARRIRAGEGGKSAVLIALTGYGRGEDRERALSAGFDVHLAKPVSLETLSVIIAQHAARR